jgi:peroxiredoxin
MKRNRLSHRWLPSLPSWLAAAATLSAASLGAASAAQADPSIADALQVAPIQKGVEYDQPTAEAAKKCTLKMEKIGSGNGWVVRDGEGRVLRRFVDTNGDNKLDQWHYFKNQIQVYRDIDSDFNRKADQYRWMGTAGTRWAEDKNEDGVIDAWKTISAEEVSLVAIEALKHSDEKLFATLLLSDKALAGLDLLESQRLAIGVRIRNARNGFGQLAKDQTAIKASSKWLHFGGSRPGLVFHDSAAEGVEVYDNVAAIVDTNGQHHQVNVGTMIRVERNWKLIDLPRNLGSSDVAAEGFFFHQSARTGQFATNQGVSEAAQGLIAELEEVDRDLASTSSESLQTKLQAKRADIIEKLAASTEGDDRVIWLKQFADTMSSAAQSGAYSAGVQRLEKLGSKLKSEGEDKEIRAYVRFRFLTAQYGLELQDPKADYAKIQTSWMKKLEQFSLEFANSSDAAEAMLQLAISKEFAGEEKEALKWFAQIARDYPDKPIASKARGAQTRIRSIGRSIEFQGVDLSGNPVDLSDHRGKIVVLHYWASWCSQDLPILKDLQARYANRGLVLIGVNVDNQLGELEKFLQTNRLAWPQLHSKDGLDGELANQLGILTPPTIFLIDKQGLVVRNNLHGRELADELKKLIR